MCYTYEAFIAAGAGMYAVSLLLFFGSQTMSWLDKRYIKDNKVIATVIFGAATMQFAEAIIHLDPDCTDTRNIIGAKFGFLSLAVLQPLFSFFALIRFGYNRTYKDFLSVIFIMTMIAYAATASVDGMPDNEVLSTRLNKNLSHWCTVDRTCEEDHCNLRWNWDGINREYRYWFYWAVVFFYPALTMRAWMFWAPLTIAVFPLINLIQGGDNVISNESASCFWGPIGALVVAITNLPAFVMNCFTGQRRQQYRYLDI